MRPPGRRRVRWRGAAAACAPPVALAVRDVLGRPLRSLGTALGVAAAIVLVLTTGALLDSMRTVVTRLFRNSTVANLRVVRAEPLTDVRARLRRRRRRCGWRAVDAAHRAGSAPSSTTVCCRVCATARLRSVKLDGRAAPPGAGGIVLTHAIATDLGVRVGDLVTARLAPSGVAAPLRVNALTNATLGKTASARRSDVARAFGFDQRVTSAVLALRASDAGRARRAIAASPDVAHVEDLAQLRNQVRDAMGFAGSCWPCVRLQCRAGRGDLVQHGDARHPRAPPRAGHAARARANVRDIALGLEPPLHSRSGARLAALGVGRGRIKRVLALYSSDLFRLPLVLSPITVATAASGIIIVLLLAQWPALRQVARESLADAVSTREG